MRIIAIGNAPVMEGRTFLLSVWLAAILAVAPGCLWKESTRAAMQVDLERQMKQAKYAPTPAQAISLDDAIRLALDYNLDNEIRRLEIQAQKEARTGSLLGMLPSFKIRGTSNRRNNDLATRSISYDTGTQSLESSVSSDRRSDTRGLDSAWELLDFGLSYLRSRQATQEVMIRQSREARARQTLALNVTESYWKLVVAQQAAAQAAALLEQVTNRRTKLQEQVKSGDTGEIEGLEKEQGLVQAQMRLRDVRREAAKAAAEFVGLLNLPPGSTVDVAMPALAEQDETPKLDLDALETEALRRRPELLELGCQEQIQRDEVRAAILKMFPNATLFGHRDRDSNPFLTHQSWSTIGVSATWDLLTIPQRVHEKRVSEKQTEIARKRRMALAVGIVTQLRLAALELEASTDQCRDARDLDALQARILAARKKQMEQGGADAGTILEKEVAAFFEHARFLSAYANRQIALARLNNTLGSENPSETPGANPAPAPVAPSGKPAATPPVTPTPTPNAADPAKTTEAAAIPATLLPPPLTAEEIDRFAPDLPLQSLETPDKPVSLAPGKPLSSQ